MLWCSSMLNTFSASAEGKLGIDLHLQHVLRAAAPSLRRSTRPHARQSVWRFAISIFSVDHPPLAKRLRNGGTIALAGLQRPRAFARGPGGPDWDAAPLATEGKIMNHVAPKWPWGASGPLGRFSAVFRPHGALSPS